MRLEITFRLNEKQQNLKAIKTENERREVGPAFKSRRI